MINQVVAACCRQWHDAAMRLAEQPGLKFLALILIGAVLLGWPSPAPAQQALASQCLNPKDPGAIEACARLIEAGRGNVAEYHYSRGSALLDNRDCDGALADFDAAVRLRPSDPSYHGGRGLVFYSCKKDFKQAALAFGDVIRLSPRNAAAYDIRGTSRRYLGDLDGSVADETAAIRLQPGFGMYYGNRAVSWAEKGDPARALADFNRNVALENNVAAVFNNRGQFLLQRQELDQAIADFTEAIRLDPRYSKPYANRAEAWRQKGDLDRSLADIGQAINIDPRDPLNYARRADTLRYRGDYQLELNGVDHLIPVDGKIASERDVLAQGVAVAEVTAATEGARKLKLVLLDACRNNPFMAEAKKLPAPAVVATARVAGGKPRTRSLDQSLGPVKGLAQVKAGSGTLVFFAAKEGQVALDGDGDNSPFAVAMLQRIATPGVEIGKVFRLVRDDVMEATAGRQEPFVYGSLPGDEDFYFVAAK